MDHTPDTQPDGSRTPPPRVPPVALATLPPEPPREPGTRVSVRPRLADLVAEVLDGLDRLGDRIAGAAGLR